MSAATTATTGATPPEISPVGGHRMAPGTAAVLGLLLVLGAGASVLRLAPSTGGPSPADVDLAVPAWGPSEAEELLLRQVAAARRVAATAPSTSADAVALLESYRAFNQADAAAEGDPRSRALADAHAEYEQWALTFLKLHGPEAYMGLGQRLTDDFVAALQRADEAALVDLGGTFRHHLRSTGLLGPDLRPAGPAAPWVIHTAFVARWAQVVRVNRPTDELLALEERRLLLRWKLAANPRVPPERREALAHELARLGSHYPTDVAIAARHAADGDWSQAARFYARAARAAPDDLRLEANARYAAGRARRR